MLDIPQACSDLAPIGIEHAGRFQAALDLCEFRSRCYYFPRLLFNVRRRNLLLLFEEVEGSILLYTLREREGRHEMRLYVPPFPFEAAALHRARARVREFNGGRPVRIEWVQAEDVPLIEAHGFSMSPREEEFVYDRAAVAELRGQAFRGLRERLAGLKRYAGLSAREFTAADGPACLALFDRFCAELSAKGIEPIGRRPMVNCLSQAAQLPASLLRGEVMENDGALCAYSFGGPMSRCGGCILIAISDHDVPNLGYALRYRMMVARPDLAWFTDSTDNGRASLGEMKRRFRPVEMRASYAARERA
jgi:hypothetical protein